MYGRDETALAVQGAARPGVRVRAHGAGLGVAFVTRDADLGDAARRLADDVIVFDPTRVPEPAGRPYRGEQATGRAARHAAGRTPRRARTDDPRGRLDPAERSLAARYVETMMFAGRVLRGAEHVVAVAPAGCAILIPPPGRHVHGAVVRDVQEARRLLRPFVRLVVAVGCDDETAGRALVSDAANVRLSRLGLMQRPPFDGPVDLR